MKFSFTLLETICCSTHRPRLGFNEIHAAGKPIDCFLISHKTYRRSNRFHRNYTRACQINNRWRHARLEERDSNRTSDQNMLPPPRSFTPFFTNYSCFDPPRSLSCPNCTIKRSHQPSNEFDVTRKREI